MTNIVYKMTFLSRINDKTPPYYYIGMKSNCAIIDGKIVDNKGRIYKSSTRHIIMKELFKSEYPIIDILYESDDINLVSKKERELHIKYNVGRSTDYFNMTISPNSTFCMSGIGTFRHSLYPDVKKRLPVNDICVISGEYVGATKGYKPSRETLVKISKQMQGVNNPFYGKAHSNKTKEKISSKKIGKPHNKHWKYSANRDEVYIRLSNFNKGKVSIRNIITGENKRILKTEWDTMDKLIWQNISKNKITLKNNITGEIKSVNKNDIINYDLSIWANPNKDKKQPLFKCNYCNKEVGGKTNFNRWHNENCKHRGN